MFYNIYMSFDQIEYVNKYSKSNYKTLLIKYRKDSQIFEWLNKKENKNGYILELIENDINKNIYTINKLVFNVKKNSKNKELYLGEWLDEFYKSSKSTRQSMIVNEPFYLNSDKLFMCYIASSVDFLSKKYNLIKPNWVNNDKYIYGKEYYAFNTKIKEYQNYLKKTAPKEFYKRNLFVGDNVLKRV